MQVSRGETAAAAAAVAAAVTSVEPSESMRGSWKKEAIEVRLATSPLAGHLVGLVHEHDDLAEGVEDGEDLLEVPLGGAHPLVALSCPPSLGEGGSRHRLNPSQ